MHRNLYLPPRNPVRGLAWTCLLGKTCGASYNESNPCPYEGSDSDSSEDSPAIDSASSSSNAGSSSSGPLSGSSPSPGSSSSLSLGHCSRKGTICNRTNRLHWLAAVGFWKCAWP